MSLGMAAVLGTGSAAGLDRHTHHRAGLAGRQPRGGGRCDQARTCGGTPTSDCVLARTDAPDEGHRLRDDHQHRGLSAVSDANRQHRRFPVQPAGDDDLRARGIAHRGKNVHSASRLLRVAGAFEDPKCPSQSVASAGSPVSTQGRSPHSSHIDGERSRRPCCFSSSAAMNSRC